MYNKRALIGASALCLFVAACAGSNTVGSTNINSAQSVASNQVLTPIKGSTQIIEPLNLPASQLAEMDVYSSDGKFIGNAGQVLADSSGRPVGLSVGAGGFLGLGSHDVIVPLGQLRVQGQQLIANYTRTQIDTLPPYVGS